MTSIASVRALLSGLHIKEVGPISDPYFLTFLRPRATSTTKHHGSVMWKKAVLHYQLRGRLGHLLVSDAHALEVSLFLSLHDTPASVMTKGSWVE